MNELDELLRQTLSAQAAREEHPVSMDAVFERSRQLKRRSRTLAASASGIVALLLLAIVVLSVGGNGGVHPSPTLGSSRMPKQSSGVGGGSIGMETATVTINKVMEITFSPPTPVQPVTLTAPVALSKFNHKWNPANGIPAGATAYLGVLRAEKDAAIAKGGVLAWGYSRRMTDCDTGAGPGMIQQGLATATVQSCTEWTFLNAKTGSFLIMTGQAPSD